MKKIILFFFLAFSLHAKSQEKTTPTLRSILLEQFQTTWNKQDWFVPVMQSLEGVTAKQAMWTPSDSVHSAGQLAYHLLFWNKRQLEKFKDNKPADFNGDNKETFTAFTEASWAATLAELNQVMKELETVIKTADDSKIQSWASAIEHISAHNAYHTGQIIYVRKLSNNWDANKGVK